MTDVYSSHSEPIQDPEIISNDVDSHLLKSPRSETDSTGSYDVESIESPSHNFPISRPLSRSSVTSGLSVTATKDGIEGKRIKRTGIPGYPLNLINKMYTNYAKQHQLQVDDSKEDQQDDVDENWSVQSLKSATSLIPQYDPSDREYSERGSFLSNENYQDASDQPRSFEFFDFDQTAMVKSPQQPSQTQDDIPQISISDEDKRIKKTA